MRHRKLDRAILDQNEPLDSDDQELVISLLTAENDQSLKLYKKVLALSILVEMPVLVLSARRVASTPLLSAVIVSLMVLLNLATLLNTVFDVEAASKAFPAVVKVWLGRLTNFYGLCGINAVLIVQVVYVAFWRESLGWKGMFVVVPMGNLVTLILLRNWHDGVAREVTGLSGLRYKYKNV